MKSKKTRLDEYIKEHELILEELITPMILSGEIQVNGQRATGKAQIIREEDVVEIRAREHEKYVGRGGFKLEAAIEVFYIDVKDKICADFGACTGGFTDVLLQNGAKKVYAIETGKGILADKIRNDPRVVNLENTNLFTLSSYGTGMPIPFTEPIEFACIDLSFVPLKKALPHISAIINNCPIVALLKPHYEAQDLSLLRKGVVKDEETRLKIVEDFKEWLEENNYILKGIVESPIKGGGGNVEYLVNLECRM
jgi:23S rRNA (cytidine1920-2'-O)/16S rRNA (cytidine1409-2'-O)-methyltransferase